MVFSQSVKFSLLYYTEIHVVRVQIKLLGACVKSVTRPHRNAEFLCERYRAEKGLN